MVAPRANAGIILTAQDATSAAFDSARRNMAGLQQQAAGLGASVSGLAVKLGTVGVALTAAFGGASLKGAFDVGDELYKLSQKTGVAVKELSALRYAGELAGVPLEALSNGFKKLAVTMTEAAGGGKEQVKIFKALGIDLKDLDGNLKGSGQVLNELADKFSRFEDGPAKAALAVKIFGKAGADMIPLLNQGSRGLAQMREEADKLGVLIGEDFARASERFNDNLRKITFASEGVKVALGNQLLEPLNKLSETFIQSKMDGDGFVTMLSRLYSEITKSGWTAGFGGLGGVAGYLSGKATEFLGIKGQESNPYTDAKKRLDDLNRGSTQGLDAGQLAFARSERERLQAIIARYTNSQAGAGRGTALDPRVLGDIPKEAAPILDATGAEKVAGAYERIAGAIRERLALTEQELKAGRELTEMEKFEVKVLDDIVGAKGKLSKAQIEGIKAGIEELKQAELRKTVARAVAKAEVDAMLERQRARNADNDSVKAWLRAQEDASAQTIASLRTRINSVRDETEAADLAARGNIGLAEAIERVAVARLRERLERLNPEGDEAARIRVEIEEREKLIVVLSKQHLGEVVRDQAKKAEEEWRRTSDSIRDSLTDALMRGFESGKGFAENLRDTLKNMFNTLILRPIIQAVLSPVSGAISSLVGGITGQGAGGGVMSGLSSLSSMGGIASALKSGWAAYSQGGLTGLATTIKTSIASMFGGGGASLGGTISMAGAAGPAAGAALPGAASAAAGSSVAVIPIVGWIAAGMMAAKGLYEKGWDFRNGTVNAVGQFSPEGVADSLLKKLGVGGKISAILTGSSVISRLFGRRDPEVRAQGVEGTFGTGGFVGQQFADMFAKGGLFRSDKSWTDRRATSPELQTLLDTSLLGISATAKAVAETLNLSTASMETFNQTLKITFGKTDEETQKAIADALASWQEGLYGFLDTDGVVAALQRADEELSGTFQRLVTSLIGANDIFKSLGQSVLAASVGGAANASDLVDRFGGLDPFRQQASSYLQNFYSPQERAQLLRDQLTETLDGVGLALPATIEGFRQLVEVQDRNTEAGRTAYATLLGVGSAFKAMSEEAGTVPGVIQAIIDADARRAEAAREMARKSGDYRATVGGLRAGAIELVDQQRTSLQQQLLELTGTKAEVLAASRQKELAAMNGTLHALQLRVWAEQDLQTAQQGVNDFAASLQPEIERWKGVAASLREFREGLATSDLGGLDSRSRYRVSRDALGNINPDRPEQAIELVGNFLREAQDQARTRLDLLRDVTLGKGTLREQEKQALTTVEFYLRSINEAQAQVTATRELLDPLLAIDESILSLRDAILGGTIGTVPVSAYAAQVEQFPLISAAPAQILSGVDTSLRRPAEDPMTAEMKLMRQAVEALEQPMKDTAAGAQGTNKTLNLVTLGQKSLWQRATA